MPPPGFEKPQASAQAAENGGNRPPGFEEPEASRQANGSTPALVPIPNAWYKSRSLQPTAAVFDPTARVRQQAQQEPATDQSGPSTSQQGQSLEEDQQARCQPIGRDQGTKRSRRSPDQPRVLKPAGEEDDSPQQHGREEDVQMARSHRESGPALAQEEEAHVSQQGSGQDVEDEQMARSHPESSPAQPEEDEARANQQGSGTEAEDVHMLGTTPPISGCMQHLAAAAGDRSSSHQVRNHSASCAYKHLSADFVQDCAIARTVNV